MNRSIYDEALEIMVNSILPRESDKANKLKVIKALEKAQKEAKLLKLYREKDKYVKTFTPLPNVELRKYRNIVKQIKELENEL